MNAESQFILLQHTVYIQMHYHRSVVTVNSYLFFLTSVLAYCFDITAVASFESDLVAHSKDLVSSSIDKEGFNFLPIAHFVTMRPPSLIRYKQFTRVYLLKSAPFCKLFAGLGSTNMSAISHLFSHIPALSFGLFHLSFFLILSAICGITTLSFFFYSQFAVDSRSLIFSVNDTSDKLVR